MTETNRREFLKGAAATVGGLAFTQWAVTNFDAAAQGQQAYVIVSDVIRGSGGEPTGPSCVQSSVFVRGEEAVWRAVIYDATTGEAINTPELVEARGLSMTATPEGQDEMAMEFGQHPPARFNPAPEDIIFYWTAPWEIPPVVTGKLKYTLVVTDSNGGTGTLEVTGNPETDTFPIALEVS
jgi:hypothetical protein